MRARFSTPGAYRRGAILDIEPNDFELCWRVGAFAGFLVGQAAARRMVARGSGTILFTGATASLRGGANFANLASPKFALRAVAQSMARELGPCGIHSRTSSSTARSAPTTPRLRRTAGSGPRPLRRFT